MIPYGGLATTRNGQAGQTQAGGVRVHDRDLGKLMTEPFRARRVQLDRDDPGTRRGSGVR